MPPIINQNEAFFWRDANVITGNPLQFVNSSSQFLGGYFFQQPSAFGDAVELAINVAPGDYRLRFFGAQTGASGIQDVFFDGVLVATFDHYFNGTNFNAIGEANVTVVNSSSVISTLITGQNASSVGFNALITRVFLNKI